MKLKADIELKIRRFFRKYKKIIIVVFVIFAIIYAINKILGTFSFNETPTTTYNPDIAVLDNESKVPKKVHKSMENFIEEYIGYCNDKNYTKAYEMISKDCKEEYFGSITNFRAYVNKKFPSKRCFAIQSYSNTNVNKNKKYIYSVKLFDDFLATGLSYNRYSYVEEKIVASYDENKNIVFSVGNFIEKNEIQSVQENEYIKVDVKYQIVTYQSEEYSIKLTNRSDYKIVIQNSESSDEVMIDLGMEKRTNEVKTDIILEPGDVLTINPIFSKFYDDGDITKSIIFDAVRIYDEDGREVDKMSMKMGI